MTRLPALLPRKSRIVRGPADWTIAVSHHAAAVEQPTLFCPDPCDATNTPDYGRVVEPTRAHQRILTIADHEGEYHKPVSSLNGRHPRCRMSSEPTDDPRTISSTIGRGVSGTPEGASPSNPPAADHHLSTVLGKTT